MKELEEYHKYLMKRHNEILTKLKTIKDDQSTSKVYREWIDQAIEYLTEVTHV